MDARLGAIGTTALLWWGSCLNVAAQTDATKAAVTACEAEVTDTVHQMRARDAQQLEFIAAKRVLVPTQNDEVGVKGEGVIGAPLVARSPLPTAVHSTSRPGRQAAPSSTRLGRHPRPTR